MKRLEKPLQTFITTLVMALALTTLDGAPLGRGGISSSEEIRIYLSTKTALEPFYIGQFQCSDSSFSEDYLHKLRAVLAFDLSHSGKTGVLASDQNQEEALSSPSFKPSLWKTSGAHYVIKGKVHQGSLEISCFSASTGAIKQFPPMTLNHSLPHDRRVLHHLSDAILKTVLGVQGVATTQILYTVKERKGEKWVSEVWRCDWDGANREQLTHENSYSVTPVFVPPSDRYTNDRFLYVSYKTGKPKIFIASMKGGKGEALIKLPGNQLLPAISLQRDKIAFISDALGKADLFIQQLQPDTGKTLKPTQLFSAPKSAQASPTFSPDGSTIAFVSDQDGQPRIYLISSSCQVKKERPILITKKYGESSCPSWSPDGEKIAYSANIRGTRQICLYDIKNREERQLTDGPTNKENPSWAPDSEHLVFNSTDGHISELYIASLSQPEAFKISSGPGIKHYPSWGTVNKNLLRN